MKTESCMKKERVNRNHFYMLMAICLGAFVSHFTAGIVNVSLPHLTEIFHAGIGTVQWITTGYLLAIASLLPVMGKLGDRFGQRRIHNLGYVCFTVSSVLIAFSPNVAVLLLLRVLQAVGASMFQATNIALITMYMPKERRGRALGIVSTAVALGGMSGPIAGGMITQWLSWNWLFLIHVPVVIVATWLAFRFIPNREPDKRPGTFDGVGAVLFTGLIGIVILGVTQGQAWGWGSWKAIALFSVSLIAFLLLFWWEKRQAHPFLPLQLFTNATVTTGLFITGSSFLLANTVLVVLPFYLTELIGIIPLEVGYVMAAYPLILAGAGPIAGALSDRYGSRVFQLLGLCGMGGGSVILTLWLEQLSIVSIVVTLALIGVGMGLVASPNNSFIMKHVPSMYVGTIGGMIALMRNIGMVFGAALGLGFMNGVTFDDEAQALDAFTSVFGINVVIFILGLAVFGYGLFIERQGRRNKKQETNISG
ncbi:MFS transporter [Brevibacillus borstelensis]|uniref:MFS transporter n=1 Tax=Brevibacillus borstelensis TaxID=45462 RepID=UPI0030C361D6